MLSRDRSKRSALYTTGWLLAVALMSARLLPMGVRPGMFFDGATYATIARNMAAGVGDLWHPVFFAEGDRVPPPPSPEELKAATAWTVAETGADSKPVYRTQSDRAFHDHPPLAFWLESLFFRALGDHYWVEKLYSALMGIGTALGIAAIWRQLFRERPQLRDCSWLPVVMWMAWPHWSWMYENNLLENTLGLMAIAGVYASLRAADARLAGWIGWTALAAAATVGAVLSKGPVGLFPLATPLGIAICLKRRQPWRSLAACGLLPLMFGALMGLVLLQPAAYECLSTYLRVQVQPSLSGQREIFHSTMRNFWIITDIAGQMVLPLLIAAALLGWARWHRAKLAAGQEPIEPRADDGASIWPAMAFCAWTAASASLPIMLSPKQLGHYAAPSYPYYGLTFAVWCAPAVVTLLTLAKSAAEVARAHWRVRAISLAGMAVVATLCIVFAGTPWRDAEVYHDTIVLGRLLPRAKFVAVSPDLAADWALQMYLGRWDDIGVDSGPTPRDYYLAPLHAAAPPGYTAEPAELVRYQLFRRTDAPQVAGRASDSGLHKAH